MILSKNDAQRQAEKQKQVRLMTYFEIKVRGQIASAIRKAGARTANEIAIIGTVAPNWLINNHIMDFVDILKSHYEQVTKAFSLRNIKAARMSMERKDQTLDSFLLLVSQWITTNSLLQATLIAKTTQNDIQALLNYGALEGLGNDAIAKLIRQTIPTLALNRAATIARTETHNAATFANYESTKSIAEEVGAVIKKKWVPVEDSRTRPDHAIMWDVPALPMDNKFTVGGSLMDRPGDMAAPSSQTINCRCVLTYEE